jgi:flagellar biosynthesis protein FliQ
MTVESITDLALTTMTTAFWIALPLIGFSMAIGLAVAVFQAATQIQEASLNFVPKLIGIGVAVVLFGAWILDHLTGFTSALLTSIATVGR